MRWNLIFLISLFLALMLPFNASSQDECKNALYDANTLYESGQITEAINRLEGCIGEIKDNESLFEAYKLMGIMLHEAKDYESRDDYIELMLKLKPEYLNYPNNDPSEFSKVVKTFHVVPDLFVGLELGGNYNMIRLKKSFSALPYEQYYQYQPGYNVGLYGRYLLKNDWNTTLSVNYTMYGVEHVMKNGEKWNQTYYEQLRSVGLRPGFNKMKEIGKKTSVNMGLSLGLNFLTHARASIEASYPLDDLSEAQTSDVLGDRNKFQPSVNADIRILQGLSLGFLELRLSYDHFLRNTVGSNDRWNNNDFVYGAQYVNDDIKLSVLSLALGYSIPIRYHIYR